MPLKKSSKLNKTTPSLIEACIALKISRPHLSNHLRDKNRYKKIKNYIFEFVK